MYYRDLFLQPIIAKILPTNLSSSELPYPWVEFLVNLKTHCFVSSISSKRRATLPDTHKCNVHDDIICCNAPKYYLPINPF